MNKKTVLIVDDEPNNIRALRIDLEEVGYNILTAEDGVQGWDVLCNNKDKIGAILFDRMMPNMDVIEFTKKLRSDRTVRNVPIIMQTAAAEREQVVEGIEAGVYYYLTKPYDKKIMLSVLSAAIKDHKLQKQTETDIGDLKEKFNLIKTSEIELQDIEDVRVVAQLLSKLFSDSERVIFGISELLLNAVEHGNLGITYEEKTELNKNEGYAEEVKRRQNLPKNKDKKVIISFKKDNDMAMLTIKDEGDGFEWQKYLELDPDRALHNHGRGIALSKMNSFDEMTYLGNGNEVICKVKL